MIWRIQQEVVKQDTGLQLKTGGSKAKYKQQAYFRRVQND